MSSVWFLLLPLTQELPAGAAPGVEWVAVALLGGILAALVVLLMRMGALGKRLETLDSLPAIDTKLRALAAGQAKLEFRRLEHLLVDIRDGAKRSDQRIAQALESRDRDQASEGGAPAPIPVRLGERIINRLLAQGYERIEILTPAEDFEAMLTGAGDVRVEARRGGAAYKGRVRVQAGAIIEVHLRAPFAIFP